MKSILIIAFLTFSCITKAQITKDSLLIKMAKEACLAFSKKDMSKMNAKNLEQELSLILLPVLMNNKSAVETVYNTKLTDQKTMQKVGMDLGMKLASSCPEVLSFGMKMASGEDFEGSEKAPEALSPATRVDPPVMTNEGETYTLISINPGDITTLTLKNAKGKIEKMYWMEYFENADDLKVNAKKYLNKKVVVAFSNKDVYNAATKNYKVIKIIESLELDY